MAFCVAFFQTYFFPFLIWVASYRFCDPSELKNNFSLSNPNAPILSDFFYQILDSLHETKFSSQQELFSFILEKAEEFGILEFISELQLEIKIYFTLFVLNYCASNPCSKNFTLLELLSSSKNDYLKAC